MKELTKNLESIRCSEPIFTAEPIDEWNKGTIVFSAPNMDIPLQKQEYLRIGGNDPGMLLAFDSFCQNYSHHEKIFKVDIHYSILNARRIIDHGVLNFIENNLKNKYPRNTVLYKFFRDQRVNVGKDAWAETMYGTWKYLTSIKTPEEIENAMIILNKLKDKFGV